MNETSRTWAQISLDALENNYDRIMDRLPESCGFCSIMKADAYGHGVVPVAQKLEELGIRYMAVATAWEAIRLRESGIQSPILVLGPCPANMVVQLADLDITVSVADVSIAKEYCRRLGDRRIKAHIQVDTGMGRLGIFCPGRLEEASRMIESIILLRNLDCEGIFTHFATSDEPNDGGNTREQLHLFLGIIDRVRKTCGFEFAIRHCANAGALASYPEAMLDMCRAGIPLYGYAPEGITGLRPVMTLKTRVVHVKEVPALTAVSYGRTYRTDRKTRLAVIPVGYADGLFRSLSGKIDVTIGITKARQVGRICMDMCMIDVTDNESVRPGSEVTVFGDGAFENADTLARKAGTIPYEILCAISSRVPRVVV